MTGRRREQDEFLPIGIPFVRQLEWRFVLIILFLCVDVALFMTGSGMTSHAVVFTYVPYLALLAIVWLAERHRARSHLSNTPLAVAAFVGDFLFVGTQMHLSGGGWWNGAAFFMLAVVVAASTVPPRALALVTAIGILVYAGKAWVEVTGILPPPIWGDFPRVDGNEAFLVNYVGFGTLVLVGAAVIQSRLMSRVRRVQQRHRAVLEASPYLVLTVNAHGVITSASRVAAAITGRTATELVGSLFATLFDDSEVEALTDVIRRTREGERVRRDLRGVAHGFIGPSRWYGAAFSRVETDQPGDTMFVILRDITAERARQEDNARLATELEEARRLELVGRLVSGVAHELNNPLAAILALTEQFDHEGSRDQIVADARVIHEQARRARSIVRDLLQVVRAPSQSLAASDVRPLVAQVVSGLASRPERARVTVQVVLPDAPCPVDTEDGSIEQVLTNLIVNALQATESGGRVDVTVRGGSTTIEIEVRDSGSGFSDEVRARLFEPFFTTRPPGHGTGLGLAVSRAIVERHGGTLEALSPRTGACFLVRLPRTSKVVEMALPDAVPVTPPVPPLRDDAEAVVAATDTRAEPVVQPNADEDAESLVRRVLLIDDEAAIRGALGRWFERRGWMVTHCSDGAPALALLLGDRESFDLVITDLKMPGLSGIDVYAALRDARPEMLERLVIVTGDVASPDVSAFLATVSSPILEKPFALAQLAEVMETIAPSSTG